MDDFNNAEKELNEKIEKKKKSEIAGKRNKTNH